MNAKWASITATEMQCVKIPSGLLGIMNLAIPVNAKRDLKEMDTSEIATVSCKIHPDIFTFISPDINECTNGQKTKCDENAICTNTFGVLRSNNFGYTCKCSNGYDGNGYNCHG